ncbi:MAG: hypothetical protein FJ279_35100, partial [Planctomycetes bacterium]|nr:hypothetical protein [Planctomycetota bacterium]
GQNELLVGVHDWTGLFSKQVDLSQVTEWHQVRGTPKDALLSVIGGLFSLYGIWDDVTLVALPAVHVADVFVQTSVRKKTLTALVTVRNEDTTQRTVRLESRVQDGPELPAKQVTLEPGASETVEVSAAWPNPKLWSHETPHLYELKSQISDLKSQMRDETSTRFGFREFWCEGPSFFLNGTRIILRATSTWPTGQPANREQIIGTYRAIKAANTIAHRLHTQPWQKLWYEVADEVGLLIVVEGAVWCDHNAYRWGDQAFLDNYATHLRRTVGNLKNHPSVVMWSLENEILHCAPGGKESPAKDPLANLGKLMKSYDPTRPITYEADLDPRGVADVVGLHYPHPEYPRVNQYPNVCYWMDEEILMKRPLVDGEHEKWKWDRQKPLYIGEFLWVPSADPSWHTIFFGDEAYTDYNLYKRRAKAMSWKMQIEAYRFHGVNGICPWTMFEGGRLDETNPMYLAQKQGYEPIAAFLREYDRNFYAGAKVRRTFVVHNDVMSPSALTLRWSATCDGQSVAKGDAPAQLGPAERTTVAVEFTSPSVSKRTALSFEWTLERGGQRVFAESQTYWIHPTPTLAARPSIGLYDADGRTAKLFEAQGVKFTRLASLAEVPSAV